MAVTIVIEDGSLVPGANSFVAVADVQTWATNRLLTFTGTADQLAGSTILACDYLRNEARFWWRGLRVSDDQTTPWPRSGAIVIFGTGNEVPSTIVPQAVKDAQCELAVKALAAYLASSSLQPDLDRGGQTQDLTAGPVHVTYMANALNETLIQLSDGLLKPYLRRTRNFPIAPFQQPDLRTYFDASNPLANEPINTGVGESNDQPSPGPNPTIDPVPPVPGDQP